MVTGLNSLPLLSDSPQETQPEKQQRLDGNVKRLIGLAAAASVQRSLESEDAAVDAEYKRLANDTGNGEAGATQSVEEDMGNTVAGDHYENVTINMPQPTVPTPQPAAQAQSTPQAVATVPAEGGLPAWAKNAITVGGISLAGLAGYTIANNNTPSNFKDTDTNTGVNVEGGVPVQQPAK